MRKRLFILIAVSVGMSLMGTLHESTLLGSEGEGSVRTELKLEDIYGQWRFDFERFDDFFNEMIATQVEHGAPQLSASDLLQRKNASRVTLVNEMSFYSFKPGKAGELLFHISRKTDGFDRAYTWTIKGGALGTGTFDFTDEKGRSVQIVATDLNHIKYILTTEHGTMALPMVRKQGEGNTESVTPTAMSGGPTVLAARDKAALLKQAKLSQEALNEMDFDAMMKFQAPAAIKLYGKDAFEQQGRAAIAQMKESGIKWVNTTFGEPSRPYPAGSGIICILPRTSIIEGQGRKVISKSYWVAIRDVGGGEWKFIDGAGVENNRESLWMMFPDLERDIVFPEYKQEAMK